MDEKEEILNLQQQIDELNKSIKALGEKQNSQYTDIMVQLRKIEDYLQSADDSHTDELYEDAKKIALEFQKVSASLLQRKLNIGYARAASLIDMLDEQGVIAIQDGKAVGQVIIQQEEE